jgi:hypothetical protein
MLFLYLILFYKLPIDDKILSNKDIVGEVMYKILNDLLSDKKSDVVFSCFNLYHFIYMFVIFLSIISLVFIFKNKKESLKNKLVVGSINLAFIMYMLDFFLMPFAYQSIDIEKLPFHICTVSCVLCFLSRHNNFFNKYKNIFAILGLIGNLIYVIYPAGVMWYQVHPLSYRVIQTLLYHGVMTSYGIFTLVFEKPRLEYKKSYKDLIVISLLVIWALLGNYLYNGTYKDYDHFFNWLFVVRDPFYILPLEVARFIMPFFMVIFLYLLSILVYFIYNKLRRD